MDINIYIYINYLYIDAIPLPQHQKKKTMDKYTLSVTFNKKNIGQRRKYIAFCNNSSVFFFPLFFCPIFSSALCASIFIILQSINGSE